MPDPGDRKVRAEQKDPTSHTRSHRCVTPQTACTHLNGVLAHHYSAVQAPAMPSDASGTAQEDNITQSSRSLKRSGYDGYTDVGRPQARALSVTPTSHTAGGRRARCSAIPAAVRLRAEPPFRTLSANMSGLGVGGSLSFRAHGACESTMPAQVSLLAALLAPPLYTSDTDVLLQITDVDAARTRPCMQRPA